MSKLILCLFALLLTSASNRVEAQLSCDSQLRLLYPEYFTHCDCHYDDWSDWEIVPQSTVDVPAWQCLSEAAYNETRMQYAVGYQCETKTETQQVCMPDLEDRLILLFGLGSGGQDYSSTGGGGNAQIQVLQSSSLGGGSQSLTQTGGGGSKIGVSTLSVKPVPNKPYPGNVQIQSYAVPFTKPTTPPTTQPPLPKCESDQRICHAYIEPRGKRSLQTGRHIKQLREHQDTRGVKKGNVDNSVPLAETPQPFSWEDHHMRFRRQFGLHPDKNCSPNDIQYILFLLDTSGSIREDNFKKMTATLSNLVTLFCKPVRVAVMTFNHEFNLEFCFGCHDSDCGGRASAAEAIKDIPYRGGWTHTGGATVCADQVLLQESCGLVTGANCISVVYITDGKSNDPTLKVCDEIKSLRGRLGVTTYAMGIQNYNEDELNCIAETSDSTSIFRFRDFDDFETAISNSTDRLKINHERYKCVNPIDPVGGQANITCQA